MSALPIGSTVRIERNDAGVQQGASGRYLGTHAESGNVLVDVEGRGRVAFTLDQISHPALLAARRVLPPDLEPVAGKDSNDDAPVRKEGTKMEDQPKRAHRASGVIKVGEKSIALTINEGNLADALGISRSELKAVASAARVERGVGGLSIRYTAADIYQIHELMVVMAEFEVSATSAVKIVARLAARERQ